MAHGANPRPYLTQNVNLTLFHKCQSRYSRVDDFPAPATYDGSQTDWTFSWRVLLVNPDQPGKVVNSKSLHPILVKKFKSNSYPVVDKSKPITYVAWAPSWCPRLLLVATNATITVWYQHQYLSNQYVCNARSEYGVPDTILCSWVDPKIKVPTKFLSHGLN